MAMSLDDQSSGTETQQRTSLKYSIYAVFLLQQPCTILEESVYQNAMKGETGRMILHHTF